MGFDPVSLALITSVVASAGTAVAQTVEGNRAAKANKRANLISANKEKNTQIQSTREAVRERRLKAAALQQQAQAGGASESSGELGALSSYSSSVNSARGTAQGNSVANDAISAQGQKATDAMDRARNIGAFNDVFQSATNVYGKTDGFKSIFS